MNTSISYAEYIKSDNNYFMTTKVLITKVLIQHTFQTMKQQRNK